MPDISGKTKLLAVIGHPIEHSLSPQIHNLFARYMGIDCVYLAFPVTPDSLSGCVAAARTLNMSGFNVTMPLKEAVIPYLDGLDESAAGTVNTVYRRQERLIGGSTDGDGFILSLRRLGLKLPEQVMVLGAGGAARAVSAALCRHGVKVIAASRRKVPLATENLPAPAACGWDEFPGYLPECGMLINATPLGMTDSAAGDFPDFGFLDALPRGAFVYDLVYAPRKTALLQNAGDRGLHVLNGIPHLVCQAALSFARFFDVPVPDEAIEQAMTLCEAVGGERA